MAAVEGRVLPLVLCCPHLGSRKEGALDCSSPFQSSQLLASYGSSRSRNRNLARRGRAESGESKMQAAFSGLGPVIMSSMMGVP